ncbi:MarR family winged helix-turn-helix transcriptional regulator [Chelativorans sp.]|uniref:MarR family winged helix-turn-helix transcriptional regulator n=1 Tax=Chelativorans sp. TaxID=2203393 RepID=UPI002810DBF3|nr:MarR family winged helix-turn-helix transcriptional regulator [Chelativorans sp.]
MSRSVPKRSKDTGEAVSESSFEQAEAFPSREEIDRRLAATGYVLEKHNAHLIRLAHQRGTALFQKAFENYSITPTQVAVLATLLRHGNMPQNQLGKITAIDTATLSPLLRRLQLMGLTRRKQSEQDQRVNLVGLTVKGVEFTLEVLPISQAVSEEVVAPLKPRDRKRFIELLKLIT